MTTLAIGGQTWVGDIRIGLVPGIGGNHNEGKYNILAVIGSDTRHVGFNTGGLDRDMKLELGKTQHSEQPGIAVTLIGISSKDGSKGSATILAEPYCKGSVMEQKTDIPEQQLAKGKTRTVRLGTSFDPDTEKEILVSYGMIQDEQRYAVHLSLKGEESDEVDLKVGETKYADRFDYEITLTALTAVDGEQGVTLLVEPTKMQGQ